MTDYISALVHLNHHCDSFEICLLSILVKNLLSRKTYRWICLGKAGNSINSWVLFQPHFRTQYIFMVSWSYFTELRKLKIDNEQIWYGFWNRTIDRGRGRGCIRTIVHRVYSVYSRKSNVKVWFLTFGGYYPPVIQNQLSNNWKVSPSKPNCQTLVSHSNTISSSWTCFSISSLYFHIISNNKKNYHVRILNWLSFSCFVDIWISGLSCEHFYSNGGLIHQIESVNIQKGQIDMGV